MRRDGVIILAVATVLACLTWYFHDQSQALCRAQQEGRVEGNRRAQATASLQTGLHDFSLAAGQARKLKGDVVIRGADGEPRLASLEYARIAREVSRVKPHTLPDIDC